MESFTLITLSRHPSGSAYLLDLSRPPLLAIATLLNAIERLH